VPIDDIWPRLLSLAVHELRTPTTVVGGYLRMLLKDHAGPLSDDQRRLMLEAEKSCGRISGLLAEMSDLAHVELGDAPFQQQSVDVASVVREAVEAAGPSQDFPPVTLNRAGAGDRIEIRGDPSRLRAAFAALILSVRREVPTASSVVVQLSSRPESGVVAIGEPEAVRSLLGSAGSAESDEFDEFRGGMGLALPLASRVIHRHGGRLLLLPSVPKGGVAVVFPTGRQG
jgi:two-component system, OmpR family, sensor kinase